MRAAFILASALLLPLGLTGQDSRAEYQELVAGFVEETAQYRDADAMVAPLLPDVSSFHGRFLDAAKRYEGTKAALPYLGWVLQNAPRNRKAHGIAVAAIDAMADLRAAELRSTGLSASRNKELYDASREGVRHLKYNTVVDEVFAQTLFDAKVLARAADGQTRDASRRSVFKLENLRTGMIAPEITADDVDGVEFKLSDYRGKVVVIDFWGDW